MEVIAEAGGLVRALEMAWLTGFEHVALKRQQAVVVGGWEGGGQGLSGLFGLAEQPLPGGVSEERTDVRVQAVSWAAVYADPLCKYRALLLTGQSA
ncbi:hypothetical protein [Hymenobacter sp. YC55]|uniref:hypothetical protein n=1 Tax=Hymenobacter sp. YC55 TaxID=3034019 RepID=UPI0023F9AB63|nr:hypothetical protein [Hymenobacter sp. YC55]MDF7815415.1 hypothetical protein [Hymenobacter sp. YC55]